MVKDNFDERSPVINFFSKHKWRIILPTLFYFLYFGLPMYLAVITGYSADLFIRSSNLSRSQLNEQVTDTTNRVLSDDFLRNLIFKYDLLASEKESGTDEKLLLKQLRNEITVQTGTDNLADGTTVFIQIFSKNQNSQTGVEIASYIIAQYEQNQDVQVMKYIPPSYDANSYRNTTLLGSLMAGLLLYSIPLILIWEIPFLFYSDKTRKMVFEPIKSDWQSELSEAKSKKQIWTIISINIYYSWVFINALWQKSPVGDSVEYVKKLVN